MRDKLLPVLFFLVLVADLIFIATHNDDFRYISKPLLLVVLGIYYILSTKFGSRISYWALFAIFFSWLGDLILLFEWYDPKMFLFGLGSFLVAHIFYVAIFQSIRAKNKIRSNAWLMFVVLLYYFILIRVLSPHLYEMTWPVRFYGIVISIMLLSAIQVGSFIKEKAGLFMIIGAILFVISDSILAINMFYKPFDGAGILIMLTYGVAQYLLIRSIILLNAKFAG